MDSVGLFMRFDTRLHCINCVTSGVIKNVPAWKCLTFRCMGIAQLTFFHDKLGKSKEIKFLYVKAQHKRFNVVILFSSLLCWIIHGWVKVNRHASNHTCDWKTPQDMLHIKIVLEFIAGFLLSYLVNDNVPNMFTYAHVLFSRFGSTLPEVFDATIKQNIQTLVPWFT